MSTIFPEGAATPASSRGFDVLQRRARIARDEAEKARVFLEEAERSRAFWDVLEGHVARSEPGSVLLHLDRNRDYFRSLQASQDPAWGYLESLRNDAHAAVVNSLRSFGRSFPEAVARAGLLIDSSSRHPRYTFRNGFVRLELDERRLVAKIQSREAEVQEYGLDIEVLVQVLQEEISRLFERDFKPQPFLQSLYTAYSAVLRAEKLADGTEVPIRRVTHRLGKNLNRFSADEFNVDLARAMRSGHTTVDGRKLHLNHTRNTRQGMLLHSLEQGGYVGFISFKREEAR